MQKQVEAKINFFTVKLLQMCDAQLKNVVKCNFVPVKFVITHFCNGGAILVLLRTNFLETL